MKLAFMLQKYPLKAQFQGFSGFWQAILIWRTKEF